MRAKIKATGEVVEITGNCQIRGGSTYIPAWELGVFVEETPIDWEQRRYELAKAAMQGLLSTRAYSPTEEVLCKYSILSADEMIKKLKEGQG